MKKRVQNSIVYIITRYQKWVSPFLPQACRFYPTCSHYAKECFQNFTLLKAGWLSLKRILRCHPYHKGGLDPIPQSLCNK